MKTLIITLFLFTQAALAMAPASDFVASSVDGDIKSFKHGQQPIELSYQPSEVLYEDLGSNSKKEIESLVSVKKEYGKMFGFANWTPKEMKVFEEKNTRILVISGHYQARDNKQVNFMEVYCASKNESKQFVITSNSVSFKAEDFRKYLSL